MGAGSATALDRFVPVIGDARRTGSVGTIARRALAALTVLAALAAPSAAAAAALYPDLQTLPPRSLRFDRTNVNPDPTGTAITHNVLRFTNTVWNAGDGRLEVRGTIDPTTKNADAYQRIYNSDGTYVDQKVGQFFFHLQHNHYHFDDWGKYELWTKADWDAWVAAGRPAQTQAQASQTVTLQATTADEAVQAASTSSASAYGQKTTSCIMDEEFIKTFPSTPGGAAYPSSGCMPNSQNLILEGLSVGWGDTYDYFRFEQWVDLGESGALSDGEWVLRSVSDPTNKIWESAAKGDASREGIAPNEATTTFTVRNGAIVDGTAPTGTITVNGVAPTTNSTSVTVRAIGRDDVSAVDQIRISNDGVTWATFAFNPDPSAPSSPVAYSWNLADTRYGGSSTGGTRTVYAQFHDTSGKWGATVTDSIVLNAPTASSPYGAAVAADGAVSHWRLGEGTGTVAADARGANPGTYTNTPTLGAPGLLAAEPAQTAVGFDGQNDYVRVADSASLHASTAVTAEAWIKPTTLPLSGAQTAIVSKPSAYLLRLNGGRLEWLLYGSTTRALLAPAGAVAAGRTAHVVGTYDGTTSRLYVNGTQVAERSAAGGVGASTSALRIGSYSGAGQFFDGVIDEAAVYGAALPAARVKAHYDTATGTTAPPTYTLSVSRTGTGTGTVTSSPAGISCGTTCTAEYGAATQVTLTAAAASGSTFAGWGGRCSGTSTCVVTMDAAASVTATFNAATSSAGYASTVLADGPAAFWRLGETSGTTAADSAGSTPGTYTNAPTLGVAGLLPADPASRAVDLDGVNDYVRVADAASLRLTSTISIEAWVRPRSLPAAGGYASLVSKPGAYQLRFNANRIEFSVWQGTARRSVLAPADAVPAGAAAHVVAVYDGAAQRIYVNGTQVASVARTGAIDSTTEALRIGTYSGTAQFYAGVVDEVAVYAAPLSAARVQAHRGAGLGTA